MKIINMNKCRTIKIYYYIFTQLFIINRIMSRRSISPIKMVPKTDIDPRDNMIRKFKEDLIIARGREKELALL
jgi:hypothetical protein